MFERPGRPSDKFARPFPNEKAARAINNGAYPPDLSLITKARPDGANYVHALLVGYEPPPAGVTMGEGMNWNKYFPGHQIAMPQPLSGDTLEQDSRDVSAFLTWAAEPSLEARNQGGVVAVIFLLFVTILAYLAYKNVWASAKRTVRITGALDPENMAKREAASREAGVEG